VRGELSASGPTVLNIWHVEDPAAFARTAFIEALARAGVSVAASPTGANPAALLPPATVYPPGDLVAKRVSLPLTEYARVILKTSYNRGADLMVCLLAVHAGSRDCASGLAHELDVITQSGVSPASTILFDGAGSDERDRTSPADMVRFLRALSGTPAGAVFRRGLAILGVDGDIATIGRDTPAAGRVQAKTGARVAVSPADQGIITALSLAGYAETASGRQVVLGVFLRDFAFRKIEDIFTARADQGAIAVAIQQSY
jgi:D-alanyl-D-alanine carboxypeptidase/D-alanyl-D-alanine-endopeptidase (penicillin-binding protein 4)